MNYKLPLQTDELWRRTRPETFSFPARPPSPSVAHLHSVNGVRPGSHALTLHKGLSGSEDLPLSTPGALNSNDLSRFATLNALDGYRLIVEPSVRIETPLQAFVDLTPGDSSTILNSIHVAPGASVTLIESIHDPGGSQLLASTRVRLGEGSKLIYKRLWQWRRDVYSHTLFTLERDATLEIVTLNTGNKVSKLEQTAELSGTGARYNELFVDLASGRSHVDVTFDMRHLAPRTFSRIDARGVVRDRAYSLHHGLIKVAEQARGADTYFKSGHLLLTHTGRADGIPKLEIETDDVKAGHGHTLSDVDQEAIYYLMSRGIPAEEAEQMYVDGFLAPLYQRFTELSELMG